MTTKRLVRISYFTMLTIIGGLIAIPLPGVPIKLTFQTLFVLLSGMVLGGKDGAFAQIAYMVLGLIGIPVFSTGGGFDYVLRPSFGYILSFPLAAWLTGRLIGKQKTVRPLKLFLCAMAGCAANYVVGATYQVLILALYVGNGWAAAFAGLATLPLLFVKDAVLVFLLCLLYPRIMTMIGKRDEQATPSDADSVATPLPPKEKDADDGETTPPAPPKKAPVPEPAGMTK